MHFLLVLFPFGDCISLYVCVLCNYSYKRIWFLVETHDKVRGSSELGPLKVIDSRQNGNLILAPCHLFSNEVPEVTWKKQTG